MDDFFWFHVSLHGPSLAKLLTEVMRKVGGPILNDITVIVREVAVRLRSWCCVLKFSLPSDARMPFLVTEAILFFGT